MGLLFIVKAVDPVRIQLILVCQVDAPAIPFETGWQPPEINRFFIDLYRRLIHKYEEMNIPF